MDPPPGMAAWRRKLVLLLLAAAAVWAVVALLVLGSVRSCGTDGGRFPDWVADRQPTSTGLYCDAPLLEYLYPWHWGAEEVCINCLETP